MAARGRRDCPERYRDKQAVNDDIHSGSPDENGVTHLGADTSAPALPRWMLRHRLSIPARSNGYYHRPELAARCMPSKGSVTMLVAPGGFGKTTLLAACCREEKQSGIPVSWLTLDGRDEPDMLDTYLAYAFAESGLDVLQPIRAKGSDDEPPFTRTALLLRAIEAHDGPVVLALDEAERLSNAEQVALINFLVQNAPNNLHVAIACRELPAGLNVSAQVFTSNAQILTAGELRFSREEIDRYFDHTLSRPALAEVASTSAGWPIAVRIRHNEKAGLPASQARVVNDVVQNWVASRLWYSFTEDESELLLDAGLFEWFDAALLDDVLGTSEALERLLALRALDGLLEPARRGESATWQLHPMLREHCVRKRRAETPARYGRVQGDIARALARRGQTVVAMQHAAHTGDATLVATILLDAGGLWTWFRDGPDALVAADRLLSDTAIERNPRLALVRCAAFTAQGQLAQARRALGPALRSSTQVNSADGLAFFLDYCLALGMVNHYGCESGVRTDEEPIAAHLQGLAEDPTLDPVVRSTIEFSQCCELNLHAEFERAMEHGSRVHKPSSYNPILKLSVDVQFGQIAMAQGRVEDAYAWYRNGERLANETFLENPWFSQVVNILVRELDLERNRVDVAVAARSVPSQMRQGSQLAAHFAAADIALERERAIGGTLDALSLLEGRHLRAVQEQLPALARHLAAQRVSLLADTGRVNEAKQAWTVNGLPNTDEGCVDFENQSWREAESTVAARLRLLVALGEFDAGRRLGEAMLRAANDRGLRRSTMRILPLCLRLEYRAGNNEAAIEHLIAFLEMFTETDYSRALVNEGAIAEAVIERFLQSNAHQPHTLAAETLAEAVRAAAATSIPQFSDRELQVLRRLATDRDDDIAAALGITRYGVRYHVGKLFGKLKAKSRREAVRRARELGLLPLAN